MKKKSSKTIAKKLLKGIVHHSIRNDANCTTCISVYQPKAPQDLEKFKKFK